MIKAVRVFYGRADNQIVWTHTLESPGGYSGIFPTTIEQDLAEIPDKTPDGETPLGRAIEDYACIEETDTERATAFLGSGDNSIVNGKLIIGELRPPIRLEPPLSTHLAILTGIYPQRDKPATVARTWNGEEYTYDCYITENIKDQYQQGDIAIDDTVLVEFLEGERLSPIVIAKVISK